MSSKTNRNSTKSMQLFDEAVALELKNNTEKAIELYQKAITLWAENVKAQYNLGLALATMGKIEQAIRAWKRAVWINDKIKSEIAHALQLSDIETLETAVFESINEVNLKVA